MKFKFSLEKVLNHRHVQMDLAKKDYLEAINFLSEEKEKMNSLVESKIRALSERSNLIVTGPDWQNSVLQINDFLKGQDLRIAQQNERLLKIEKVVEARREILKDALTEVKIMERLKETKKLEFLQEAQIQETEELDEISTIRFVRMTKE